MSGNLPEPHRAEAAGAESRAAIGYRVPLAELRPARVEKF
jgi:hypothetical protein